jgi:membrane protein required for colicin V production
MTWVDLVVLGVMALSGLLACMRGLVREVLSIGAWFAAFVIASKLNPMGREIAARWIHDQQIAATASFVVILLVALVVLKLIARWISRLVSGVGLGGIDRTLGLVFGLARGALLVIIAYILAGMTTSIEHWPDPVKDARCLPYVYKGAVWIRENALPEEYRPGLYAPPATTPPTAASLLQASPQGRIATGK